MRRLRVGLAQVNPTVGDIDGNTSRVLEWLARARGLGCDLVAFPELIVTGYPPEDLLFKSAFIEANLRALAHIARATTGLTAVVGFVDKRDDIFNAAAVLHDGAVAGQDELVFDGQSFLFNARGECIARGRAFEEDLVVADIDRDAAFRARLHDARRRKEKLRAGAAPVKVMLPPLPALAKPPLPPREVTVLEPEEEILQALVVGTRDYVRKNGFQRVVIGLSGGIDSALVAAIAVRALGAENVSGVSMPSPFSSAGTRADARRVARNLGIEFLQLPITAVLRAYKRGLAGPFKGLREDVTEENLQARIRGNLLMALSNKFGWLVLTTGNKSEIGVGYTTLYGDMAGGFAVIKDVPKTLVYRLARHVNRHAGRDLIPESVFTRAPSAELRPNQTDQDTLPPYPLLDAILEAYVEQDKSVADIVALGFDPETVRRVVRMVDANEYKRRQGPIGVKITPRAFGRDWRLPIVNRFRQS